MARQSPSTQPQQNSTLPEDEPTNSDWQSLKPYDVLPGLCVIINNMLFINGNHLPAGKMDEDSLHVLFKTLGFDVRIHRNLTAQGMMDKVQSYGKIKHTGVFLLIILSHGGLVDNKEVVSGTDCRTVEIRKLERFFYASNCPSLHGVPKIFLIDACRGIQEESIYTPEDSDCILTKSACASQPTCTTAVPGTDSGHFAILYASTYGNVSFITEKGSRLTQTFVEVTSEASLDKTFIQITQEVKTRLQVSGAGQTAELVDRLNHAYYIKRRTNMRGIQEQVKRFYIAIEKWIPVREETIAKIEASIETLRVHHRNVNISRITGSTVAIAGTTLALVGLALAPVTFGASIGLSVGGTALAVTGGGTAAGASIADRVIEKSNIKQAQEQLTRDYEKLKEIRDIAEDINSKTNDIRQQCPGVSSAQFDGVLGKIILGRVASPNSGTASIGSTLGSALISSITVAGELLNVVLMPINMIEIVRSSVSLAKGSQTRAIKQLKDLVEKLIEQKEAIKLHE